MRRPRGQLRSAFGLDEAVVVPVMGGDAAKAVGLALGQFLSEAVADGMMVGVGWGRTLTASLAGLRPVRREKVRVVSLLGGVVEAAVLGNPLEFSWRMASQFGADCYLMVAPAIVDSQGHQAPPDREMRPRPPVRDGEGPRSRGGVGRRHQSAIDFACCRHDRGERNSASSLALGAVADVLCNFLDRGGQSVPHALNRRVMSVDLEAIESAGHVLIATGGAHRARRHPRRDQAHRLQHADYRRGRRADAASVNGASRRSLPAFASVRMRSR